MTEPSPLLPEAIRTIPLYGDEIPGALVRIDGEAKIYIPLRALCDFLGLSWAGQRERTMRDEVLADVVRFVRVTRTNSPGSNPNILGIPLEVLPGWPLVSARSACYTSLYRPFHSRKHR